MATRILKSSHYRKKKNIQGHKRFIREVQPDFIKLMSDGYFAYPNPAIAKKKKITSRIGDHSTTRARSRLDKRAGGLGSEKSTRVHRRYRCDL